MISNVLTKESAKTRVKGPRRPLLVIDGDSFAHRAYHALPKNIQRDHGRPARRPERVGALVAWDAACAGYWRFLLGGKSRENTGCSMNFLGS
jgi:hypothetical protein